MSLLERPPCRLRGNMEPSGTDRREPMNVNYACMSRMVAWVAVRVALWLVQGWSMCPGTNDPGPSVC